MSIASFESFVDNYWHAGIVERHVFRSRRNWYCPAAT